MGRNRNVIIVCTLLSAPGTGEQNRAVGVGLWIGICVVLVWSEPFPVCLCAPGGLHLLFLPGLPHCYIVSQYLTSLQSRTEPKTLKILFPAFFMGRSNGKNEKKRLQGKKMLFSSDWFGRTVWQWNCSKKLNFVTSRVCSVWFPAVTCHRKCIPPQSWYFRANFVIFLFPFPASCECVKSRTIFHSGIIWKHSRNFAGVFLWLNSGSGKTDTKTFISGWVGCWNPVVVVDWDQLESRDGRDVFC